MTRAEPSPTFRVFVETDERLVEPTRDLFSRHGLRAEVVLARPTMDPGTLLLENLASLVIIGPATAFLSSFATAAGKDAWERLKAFLRDRRQDRAELVMVGDLSEGIRVLLSETLPDDALRALFEIDLHPFTRSDPLAWDSARKEWRPTTYPGRRADLFGWFTPEPQPDRFPVWHLTRDPGTSPKRALCGQQLGPRTRFEATPWRTGTEGPPCDACASTASRTH